MTTYIENQPADSSSLASSPVRINLTALFEGDIQPFRVRAQPSPGMTVAIAGDNDRGYVNGNIPVDYAGGNSPTFTAPAGASEKQIDLLHVDRFGVEGITSGTPTTGTPSPPTYPGDKMVVAEIYLRQGMVSIKNTDDASNGYIYKVRSPLVNLGGSVPAGLVSPYAGVNPPTGWLLCDGTTGLNSVSDTSLVELYAAIGTTFGGAGASDFDLPDMRGNFPLGRDNMGPSSAPSSRNRVTESQADTVGSQGGSPTALIAHSHGHSHGQRVVDHTAMGNGGTQSSANPDDKTNGTTATDATSAGSGSSSMNPYMTFNYIIKK